MKIYTQRQVTQIKNQALNKIYHALMELNEKDHSDETGAVKDRHGELLDIALKHLNSKPTPNVYDWIIKGHLKNTFL